MLPNGLRVALQEDHRVPRVAVHLVYDVGLGDAPQGFEGLPHLVEHLMFKGSRNVPEDGFSRLLERAGAFHVNAETHNDITVYHELVPAHQLPLALWLESDRLGYLLDFLNKDYVERQKKVVLNEWRQRVQSSVQASLFEYVAEELYPPGHRYSVAWDHPDDIDAIRLEHVQWFFQNWYQPKNVILSLVGDFNSAETRQLIDRYFGPLTAYAPTVARAAMPPVKLGGEHRLEVETFAREEGLMISWPTPPLFTADDVALDLVASILNEERYAFFKQLVETEAKAKGASAAEISESHGSRFTMILRAQKEEAAEELLAEVDSLLEEIRTKGIAEPVRARALARIEETLKGRRESLEGRALYHAYFWREFGTPEGFERVESLYRSVTCADLQRVVREYLRKDSRVVALVRYNPHSPPNGAVVSRKVVPAEAK